MMNGIEFEKVSKTYGNQPVVKELNLAIAKGERLILLGPSGCGKTTTLRMIAGLENITAGTLWLDGQDVTNLPPGERNVAMVFQNYALYPHMTVWENITFGLTLQKLPPDEIKARTDQALTILNLSGYEKSKPSALSGGQKQRVALARALVKRSPYFLLDEPLSNLDAQLRLQARTELVKIHELYRPTLVYVTHDQVEAMTVGERIAIMNHGDLQQLATPAEIYAHPANIFVAGFIGSPPMNLLECRYEGGLLYLAGTPLEVPGSWQPLLASHPALWLGLRPEHCKWNDSPLLSGQIEGTEHLGSQTCLQIRLTAGNQKILTMMSADQLLSPSASGISFSWETVNFFSRQSGQNIGQPAVLPYTCAS